VEARNTGAIGQDSHTIKMTKCIEGNSAHYRIAWLSVYPHEAEALHPPLTYLRSIKAENECIGGMSVLVATVEPVFV
jgi:hypothetical protein